MRNPFSNQPSLKSQLVNALSREDYYRKRYKEEQELNERRAHEARVLTSRLDLAKEIADRASAYRDQQDEDLMQVALLTDRIAALAHGFEPAPGRRPDGTFQKLSNSVVAQQELELALATVASRIAKREMAR